MSNSVVNALNLVGVTADTTGNDMDNASCRSAVVVIDITAIDGSGSPSMTFTVEGKDPISGKYYTILASAAKTSTGTTVLRIDPNIAASANLIAQDVMPKVWRVKMVKANTLTNGTATVGVSLVG